ncbi:MAG: hemolysin III family protein [Acidimicrobiia bacterium]|nr:hemolysin III family protein [Acidimicrobiia bacterium]
MNRFDAAIGQAKETLACSAQRWTLGPIQNPVRGFLHGGAAVASIVGTVFLLLRAPTAAARVAVVVFGLGLLGLYTTSSLYHSVPWSHRWKSRMQRLDHSMIFVLIAASYSPVALVILDGPWRWVTMAAVWGLAVIGIAQRVLSSMERHVLSFSLMVVMGWMSLPIMAPLSSRAGTNAVGMMALGGVLYTVGMLFKVTRWPKLWPRVFSAHELFHVLVVSASVSHWIATYRFVLPAAA